MRRFRATMVALVAGAVTGAAPAAAETGVSNAKAYSVAMTSIDGATADRMGRWDAKIAELSEGDPAVVEAFNRASRTSAQSQIDRAARMRTVTVRPRMPPDVRRTRKQDADRLPTSSGSERWL